MTLGLRKLHLIFITGYWQDDLGGNYAVKQVGNRLHWVGDRRPAFMNVFDGIVTGDTIRGDWVDVPGGQENSLGQLSLCIDTPNRLVKIFSDGYGASVFTRAGTPVTPGPGRCDVPSPSEPQTTTGVGPGPIGPPTAPGAGGGVRPPQNLGGGAVPSGAPPSAALNLAPNTPTDGVTLNAQNLRYYALGSYQQCDSDCQKDPNCRGWSWVKPGAFRPGDGAVCYLVSRVDNVVRSSCCIAGIKAGAAQAATAPPAGGANGATGGPAPTASNAGLLGTWEGDGRGYHLGFKIIDRNGTLYALINGDGNSGAVTVNGRQISWVRPDSGQLFTGTLSTDAAGNPRIDGRVVWVADGKDNGGFFAVRGR